METVSLIKIPVSSLKTHVPLSAQFHFFCHKLTWLQSCHLNSTMIDWKENIGSIGPFPMWAEYNYMCTLLWGTSHIYVGSSFSIYWLWLYSVSWKWDPQPGKMAHWSWAIYLYHQPWMTGLCNKIFKDGTEVLIIVKNIVIALSWIHSLSKWLFTWDQTRVCLFVWVLWHINPCRLFNAKSIFI